MQNEMMQNAELDGVSGFLLAMLWAFGFMVMVAVAYIGRRTNERKARTMGYELEVIKTAHQYSDDANHSLANFLTKVKGEGGFPAYFEGYNHTTRRHTKIVTDGSLSSGGVEVVSPPLTRRERRTWLTSVTTALKGLVKIDRTCGVHFHDSLLPYGQNWAENGNMTFSQAKRAGAKAAFLYSLFQEAFDTIVPYSRRDNSYCEHQRWIPNRVRELLDGDNSSEYTWLTIYEECVTRSRYVVVNLAPIRTYGTIEYRQHAGSINAVKLDAWGQLCGMMTSRAMTITDSEVQSILTAFENRDRKWTVKDLGHFLGLAPNSLLVRYYSKRADQLAGIAISKCEECARHDCVGCIVSPPNKWSDVHMNSAYNCGNDDCYGCSEGYGRNDCDYYASTFGLGIVMTALTLGPLVAALALIVGCGIGAIHSRGKQWSSGPTGSRLWVALSDRGNQASGVGWIDDKSLTSDGEVKTYYYSKAPQSSKTHASSIKRLLSAKTWWAMFHTRYATHGENNADNAHPHFSSCNQIMLVHNGVVGNYDQVWRDLKREPTGPVDSQAIAECLAVGGIDEVIKHCVGSMSLIWADQRDPAGTLHFWTNGENPLHFGRLDNPSGDIMIASTESLWKRGAGSRAMTKTERRPKTRQVKVSKWASRTEQVKDKRGRPVMVNVKVPTHNWACTVGKHYTISPEGVVSGYMTEGWAETIGYGAAYNWQSYGNWYGTAEPKATKATGDADTCGLPVRATQEDMDMIFDIMDKDGGWPAFMGLNGVQLHGYCARSHQGINGEGERYPLNSWVRPWVSEADRKELLQGEFEDDFIDHGLDALGWPEWG